jgi:hypothetical protein
MFLSVSYMFFVGCRSAALMKNENFLYWSALYQVS